MRVTVFYRGEPIGTSDLTIDPPFAIGTIQPFSAYGAIRPILRDESRAMCNFGFLPPDDEVVGGVDANGDAQGRSAFARAAEVYRQLELRAEDGSVVAIESLEITDLSERSEITLFGSISPDGEGMPARIPRAPRLGRSVERR